MKEIISKGEDNSLDNIEGEVAVWDVRPFLLVSLFDMLERYAFSFYEVTVALQELRSSARTWAFAMPAHKVPNY